LYQHLLSSGRPYGAPSPCIQHRFDPLKGTFLLGLLWSAWHFFLYLPVWFAGGAVGGVVGVAWWSVHDTGAACSVGQANPNPNAAPNDLPNHHGLPYWRFQILTTIVAEQSAEILRLTDRS
jgi:hypothetical protein